MSQEIFDVIDPSISGTELATILNDFKDALVSGMSGTSRPTEIDPGGIWVDTALDPASWSLKLWTGSIDIEIVKIDLSLGVATSSVAVDSFSIRKVSADSTAAILNLIKRRIASNGQVASGDVVGEVRVVGRTNSSTDPVVAKMIWTAGENQTTSAFGGTLSFYSTPAGTNTLLEHLKFAAGQIESVVSHKLNALTLVAQSVASTATITQLSAAKAVVEIGGTTATAIKGINSAHASKVITIHARTSGAGSVTLKHQDTGAVFEDRMTLPGAKDIVISPQGSVTLYYCTSDANWKMLYASARFDGFTTTTLGPTGSIVIPTGVTQLRVLARKSSFPPNVFRAGGNNTIARTLNSSTFTWGYNADGQLGDGTVVSKSSPVQVLGGLIFSSIVSGEGSGFGTSNFWGITPTGAAYAWGTNLNGELGVGGTAPRSSPVAVLGGITFASITVSDSGVAGNCAYGISSAGTLYAWGDNTLGKLGLGDLTQRSSPIQVLGGLTFQKVVHGRDAVLGLTSDGTLYGWGRNSDGQLGVGDVNPRSSPVQVLGGLKFKDVAFYGSAGGAHAVAITASGVAYSWGRNTQGCLGLGDSTARSSPVAVLGGLAFKSIQISASFMSGITTAGVAYAWGTNTDGQLGVGNTTSRSSPVAVLGGLVFRKTSLGPFHTYGLTTTGSLYAWGINTNGELGLGDVTSRSSPVAVLGGLSFLDVSNFKNGGIFGVSSTGALYAWGDNTLGQLGVGNIIPRSSPVAVVGGLNMGLSTPVAAMYDVAVTPGDTWTFSAGVEKRFFGTLALPDNTEYLDLEYVTLY